jgi:hypothetical protein
MAAIYTYAIVPTGDRVVFDVAGVDNHHDEVYSLPYGDVAAIVSASTRADYRDLNRQEAVSYLVAHQRVVEAVMQNFPLLPVKFGTVLPDEAWVRRLLEQGMSLFQPALAKFADRVQMEVVILWNLQEVFQEIGQEEAIVRLKAQVVAHPPEETEADRIALGRMVQASLEQRRAALRDRLLLSLRQVALEVMINPLMDDSMVVNVALLVDEAGWAALDERLELLDEEFEGRLHFRCVGPLPPYSFATVEVQLPSFETVNEARRWLGLKERATTDEIRRAYRRLAGRLHPDHNPQAQEAQARMAELSQAYELLVAYAESQALAGGDHNQRLCHFDQQTIEQTLLISIRRQGTPA